MAKTISVWFEKGGTGKTTAAFNLSAGLARKGSRVLLIDVDPNAGATKHAGLVPSALPFSLADAVWPLIKRQPANTEDLILPLQTFDLLPSNGLLEAVEDAVKSALGSAATGIMGAVIAPVAERYDYIIIDGSPSKSLYNMSALAAGNQVILPVKAQYLEYKGLEDAVSTIATVRQQLNPGLIIGGILVTQYKKTNHTDTILQGLEELRERKGVPVFRTKISARSEVVDASLEGKSIFEYQSWCKQAKEFESLVEEVLANG